MTAAERIPLISVEQYLAAELDAEIRHEYLGGYVHAMAGGTNAHNRIATNFLLAAGARLRGKRCQVMNSDVKVRVQLPTHTRFYYPDGMVVCEANAPEETFQDRPVVIAEVVSESTRRTDQTEKRDAYLTIPSLRVYLLIETDYPSVTAYRRTRDGEGLAAFQAKMYDGLTAVVPLDEVEAELPLAELYERVEFGQLL